MAGRFLFQKFSSGLPGSMARGLLSAHASASARAGAGVASAAPEGGIRTLSNLSHEAALHTGTVVPKSHGVHVYVYAARSSAATPMKPAVVDSVGVPKRAFSSNASNKHEPKCGRGQALAARYLSTVPCCHAVAKIAWSTTGMPSIVIDRKKSAFVDSVRGVRRIFSSTASNKHGHSWKARLAAWVTEKRRRGVIRPILKRGT
ncbi:hypothetical protein ACP70R_017798 [Stipagrostis hirtigluma subsp. patula]